MLRSVGLIFLNEFRLQLRDRASLFMLFVAPVLIIAVAGFSLGNLYGTTLGHNDYLLAIVDQDHARVARAIIEALSREPGIHVVKAPDANSAHRIVLDDPRAPLALIIPPNTTAGFESGQSVTVKLFVDPVKRLQASVIKLRLNELSQRLTSATQAEMHRQLTASLAELRARLEEASARARAPELAMLQYRRQLAHSQKVIRQQLRLTMERQLRAFEAATQASIAEALALTRQRLEHAMAEKQASAAAVQDYLQALSRSEAQFDRWFAKLKAMAGSNAARIPPPPSLPQPPTQQQIAQLTQPLTISIAQPQLPSAGIAKLNITLPELPTFPNPTLDLSKGLPLPLKVNFPGTLSWQDVSTARDGAQLDAFEQYVPGFGVTFLLIDMLWGMSVALMDERQWGTLQRMRITGASVAGMLIGRVSARTLIGFVQMIVLFGVGWLLFGIQLGTYPSMLLLPAAAIAFAAAGFGLVVAAVAPSRDSVLPIGSVAAMVMSALGGCWWPLEFEPAWMRAAALSVPTTWTMRAFNDLMIRGLAPRTVVWPTTITIALGLIFLAGGIFGSPRLYR
jgi:ABC-type multidrug transport system permease subunit